MRKGLSDEETLMASAWYKLSANLNRRATDERVASMSSNSFLAQQRTYSAYHNSNYHHNSHSYQRRNYAHRQQQNSSGSANSNPSPTAASVANTTSVANI